MSQHLDYKFPHLALEHDHVHPSVRQLVEDAAEWCAKKGFPRWVVTHCIRTIAQQEAIYWKRIMKFAGCTEAQARERARKKFSWHMVACAEDGRNSQYTRQQLLELVAYLKVRGPEINPKLPWEILSHDVGAGDHIHVGIRDESWRKTFAVKAQ